MFALFVLCLFSVPQTQDPLLGQLPKRDLGVAAFLAEHPDWDGRGIRVAVLDTGIDPGHPFLQRTSDGRRKLVDFYDATTDGRLDTSTTAVAEDGEVLGLTGRRLELGHWAVGGREFHLGRIDVDFLPAGLRGKVLGHRRSEWEKGKREFEEAGIRWEAAHGDDGESSPREKETARKWESFRDPGPVWDVLCFRDGEAWKLVIDNDQDGDLDEEPALGAFAATGDWATLGDEALLNYAADVAEDGNRAILYFDTAGHGTHVAGIIGAWEGEGARLNGLAPGVELVAIKIGDGKFGASTSGFSIAKALDYALQAGCQVANISFGGPSFFADGKEPDARAIAEARARGLIVVTSAGNEGPALSTVGAPATSSGAIAVAAAVWPDTQRANYAALDPVGPVLFDFSSRGPLPNGSLGVELTAPGAALSSLPSWGGTKAENYNGTSMAAPQTTACVALLLCAAEAEGLPHEPARVERALRLGARPIPGFAAVEQGYGAIQLGPSFAALEELADDPGVVQEYEVQVRNPYGVGGGIYERDLPDRKPFERRIGVRPIFPEGTSNEQKADFLRSFRIRAEDDWVQVPEALFLNARGRSFPVVVDPSGLGPGLHTTRILLEDADRDPEVGPDRIVPVTIVIPESVDSAQDFRYHAEFRIRPGELRRLFLRVPQGGRHALIRVTQHGAGSNEFRSGAGTVSGFRFAGDRQAGNRFFLTDGEHDEQMVPTEPGTVFEYALASRWAVNQAVDLVLDVEFLGLEPQHEILRVPAGQGVGYLAVRSPLRAEDVRVSARIEGVARPVLAPWRIEPDPIRQVVFDDRGMFQAVVEWPMDLAKASSSLSLVTPDSIQTTELREDLMLEVYDANGRSVNRQIVAEEETSLPRLDPGHYLFRLRYPALGKDALEAAYAGAEIHVHDPQQSIPVSTSLDEVFAGQGSGRLRLSYEGAASIELRIPELAPLSAGAWYFGSVRFTRDGHELLRVPLRVERPAAGGAVAASAPGVGSHQAADDARAAWETLQAAAEAPEPGALLDAARAWADADPSSPEAALAVLDALANAGLYDFAREEARSYLGRFPKERKRFLDHLAAWN